MTIKQTASEPETRFYRKRVVINGKQFLEIGDAVSGKKTFQPTMPAGFQDVGGVHKPTKKQLRALRRIRAAIKAYPED